MEACAQDDIVKDQELKHQKLQLSMFEYVYNDVIETGMVPQLHREYLNMLHSDSRVASRDGEVCIPLDAAHELLVKHDLLESTEIENGHFLKTRHPPYAPHYCNLSVRTSSLQLKSLREVQECTGPQKLTVSVVAARNLKAMDIIGTSDPYCILKVGRHD